MGLSCETEVSTDCVLTRLPTCVVACPATPRDQRANLREAEIQLCRVHCCLRRFNGGFRLGFLLHFIVELASGNRMRLSQRSVAIHVDLGERKLRFGLAKLALAWCSAASNGRGSISKSTWPFSTWEPSR